MLDINLDYYARYHSHYNDQLIEPIDIIKARGHLEAFASGNILKYACRLPYKGQAKSDLLKIIGYCRLLGVKNVHVTVESTEYNLYHSTFVRTILNAGSDYARIAMAAVATYENIQNIDWLNS
jgi:molybdenum cofactor biosynthesis enzyme